MMYKVKQYKSADAVNDDRDSTFFYEVDKGISMPYIKLDEMTVEVWGTFPGGIVTAEFTPDKHDQNVVWVTPGSILYSYSEEDITTVKPNYYKEIKETLISDLDMTVRTTNLLKSIGVNTVQDLVNCREQDLLQVANFNKRCLVEVREILLACNLRLAPES